MKRKIFALISILLISILSFSSVVLASDTSVPNDLPKDIVSKANKGDVKAKKVVDDYFKDLTDRANKGDKDAFKKIQNLDCFNDTKVKEKLSKEGLKLAPGESKVIYLDDGSAIKYEVKKETDNSVAATLKVSKSWYWGASYASLTTNVDNSGSTRYICHIARVWPTYVSAGGTISGASSGIDQNDANPAYCHSSATFSLTGDIGSISLYMYCGVDSAGAIWVDSYYP